jgi:hypothetical protein
VPVDCRVSLLVIVVGSRLLVVMCRLSGTGSTDGHFFHCRCPAVVRNICVCYKYVQCTYLQFSSWLYREIKPVYPKTKFYMKCFG